MRLASEEADNEYNELVEYAQQLQDQIDWPQDRSEEESEEQVAREADYVKLCVKYKELAGLARAAEQRRDCYKKYWLAEISRANKAQAAVNDYENDLLAAKQIAVLKDLEDWPDWGRWMADAVRLVKGCGDVVIMIAYFYRGFAHTVTAAGTPIDEYSVTITAGQIQSWNINIDTFHKYRRLLKKAGLLQSKNHGRQGTEIKLLQLDLEQRAETRARKITELKGIVVKTPEPTDAEAMDMVEEAGQ